MALSGSVLTPTTTSLSEYFFCIVFNSGIHCRQGALQVAQKLRSTYFPSSAGLSPTHLSTSSLGCILPNSDRSDTGSESPVSVPSAALDFATPAAPGRA